MADKHPKLPPFEETVIVYWCDDDDCYIAHGLRTDQVGLGARIVDAMADLIKALNQVLDKAQSDPSLGYLREAPSDIQDKLATAERLPGEMYEVAHKIATGEWPPLSKDMHETTQPEAEEHVWKTELSPAMM